MDDDDAGIASTLLRGAALAAHLAALPGPELLDELGGLSPPQLRSLLPFVPGDCRCPLKFGGCTQGCPPGRCDCSIIPEPCEHILAAQAKAWPLPVNAVAYLLLLSSPVEYSQPRLPEDPSRNTHPDAQVAVMAGRRRRGRHLRHPLDWIRHGLESIDEHLTRRCRRLRNGADAVGELLLEGDGQPPKPKEAA